MEYTIHPIAHIRTDFTDKFGIPRQSGLVPELEALAMPTAIRAARIQAQEILNKEPAER